MKDMEHLLESQGEEIQGKLSLYEARTMMWSMDRIVRLSSESVFLTLAINGRTIGKAADLRPILSSIEALKSLTKETSFENLVFKELTHKENYYQNEILRNRYAKKDTDGNYRLNVGLIKIRMGELEKDLGQQVKERGILANSMAEWRSGVRSALSIERLVEIRI